MSIYLSIYLSIYMYVYTYAIHIMSVPKAPPYHMSQDQHVLSRHHRTIVYACSLIPKP